MNSVTGWGLSSSLRNWEMNHFSGPRHFLFQKPIFTYVQSCSVKERLGVTGELKAAPSSPTPHCVLTQSAGIIPPLCLWSPENRGESESGWQGLTHSPPCVCPRPSHPWTSLWFSQQLPLGFSWEPLTIFFLIVFGLQPLLFPFLSAFCTGLFRICPQLAPYAHTLSSACSYLASDFEHPLWIMPLPALP